jgi:hypothetical protein
MEHVHSIQLTVQDTFNGNTVTLRSGWQPCCTSRFEMKCSQLVKLKCVSRNKCCQNVLCNDDKDVRLVVLMAVPMNNTVLWDVCYVVW